MMFTRSQIRTASLWINAWTIATSCTLGIVQRDPSWFLVTVIAAWSFDVCRTLKKRPTA